MSSLKNQKKFDQYSKFSKINGKHPLQKACPDSFVFYRARTRHDGRVVAFNFDLAREIGLISSDHSNEMNEFLEQIVLDTFSIIIINEFDIENEREYPKEEIRPNMYMATRYLQLQHPNKQGKTSGDGRSIWNGQVKNKGKTYDISSCGTGATKLSPAVNIHERHFESGDPTISYGCGYSEVDEGFASLFFSEVFQKNNTKTERVLGVIEYPGGYSVNIRVNENLLRPSHFFSHLKQGNYLALKNIVDYFIDTEEKSKRWKNVPKLEEKRYEYFLEKMVSVFAQMAAGFEDDYIFCWLDWDGDNILMDGGVIDYGSVRQFGLYHDEYRYDDVQRFSTTIKEQKHKAKYIVQSFVQIVDFLNTEQKKNISKLKRDKSVKSFDKIFEDCKNKNLIQKIGLNENWQKYLLKKHTKLIGEFRKDFSYFEKTKSKKGLHEVPDGINWSAIFCMRDVLRELPQLFLFRGDNISDDEFINIIKSSYALDRDLVINSYRSKKINQFQNRYWKIIKIISKQFKIPENKVLLEITMRSSIINKYDRVTGDSVSTIVFKVLKQKKKLGVEGVFEILKDFINYQNHDPSTKEKKNISKKNEAFMRGVMNIVRDFREGL